MNHRGPFPAHPPRRSRGWPGMHRRAVLAAGALALAGCAAGPDWRRPPAPAADRYTAGAAPSVTAAAGVPLGEAQRLVAGASPEAQWWRGLRSARLDALVEEALQASPTLEAASATLRQAQETLAARTGATVYPQADVAAGVQRQHINGAPLGQSGAERTFELYTATLGAAWDPDLAGGNRRTLEALAAQVEHQRYQLEASRLALAGNVASTAIVQAKWAAQLQAGEAIVAAQAGQVDITRRRLALGAASHEDLLALEAQLAQARAQLPALRSRLAQADHLLAVLLGRAPAEDATPRFALAEFGLPADLPLRLPSELVRRRPDIRASEALMHAANAQHGAALARLYPRITLSASLGSQALAGSALFGAGSMAWGLAGQLAQPLFQPGLPAEARAAEAGFEAAAANYRQTVLQALRGVADVLRALEHDAQALAAQADADAAAQASLASIRRRHELGVASYLQLLVAEQQAQQARLDLIATQAQRLLDSVALYQAMGGSALDGDG